MIITFEHAAQTFISSWIACAVSKKANKSVFKFTGLFHYKRIFGVIKRSIAKQQLHIFENLIESIAGISFTIFGCFLFTDVDLVENIAEANWTCDNFVIIRNNFSIDRIPKKTQIDQVTINTLSRYR